MAFHRSINLFLWKDNTKVKLLTRPKHYVIPEGHSKWFLRAEETVNKVKHTKMC